MGVSMAKSKARRIAAEAGVLSFGRTRAHSSNPLDHVSAGGGGRGFPYPGRVCPR